MALNAAACALSMCSSTSPASCMYQSGCVTDPVGIPWGAVIIDVNAIGARAMA